MSSVHVSANPAERARARANLTPADLTLLKAGAALRNAKGKLRRAYTPDEANIVARARRLLWVIGERMLSRRLVLRSGKQAPYVPIVSIPSEHKCPLCGRVHVEPRPPGRPRKKR